MSTNGFKGRLLVLDTVMVDVALHIDVLPTRGGDALAHQRLVTAGGGFNVMSACVRQGCPAYYVGQLGEGSFSRVAQTSLAQEGIPVLVATRGPLDLGACAVLVECSGERTFITSPGAELTLTAADLAGIDVRGGDVVYASGYNIVYPEIASTVVTWLESLPPEVLVAFDPGPRVADIDEKLLHRVLARVDWLFSNSHEAMYLTDAMNARSAAAALFSRWHPRAVVVRDGAHGCVGADEAGIYPMPGYPATVIDTNGAGDVHNGVVIAERLQGTSFATALDRANAAASIAIATFGPASCPRREVVLARVARGHDGLPLA